jgi:hypothetical protein
LKIGTVTTSFSGITVLTVFQASEIEVRFDKREVGWANEKVRGVACSAIVAGLFERR